MVNLTHRLGPAINCYNVLARDMKHLSFTILFITLYLHRYFLLLPLYT